MLTCFFNKINTYKVHTVILQSMYVVMLVLRIQVTLLLLLHDWPIPDLKLQDGILATFAPENILKQQTTAEYVKCKIAMPAVLLLLEPINEEY